MARAFRILGLGGECCAVDVDADKTVRHLKGEVERATGIPAREQRLLDGTRELRDGGARLEAAVPGDEGARDLTLVRRDPEQAEWLERVEADFAGNALQRAPAHIREDREVILAAMRRRPNAFRCAAPSLQADRDFMLVAVRESENALQYASRQLLADRELVLEACAHHGKAIQFASRELRSDHEIALTAVKSDAEAVRLLAHELWSSRDFILALVRHRGQALKIASAELQKDREVCLAAASNDGHALQHASQELLGDRDFVAAAVKVSKFALRYASGQLQGDPDLVMTAVQADGGALCYAAPHVRGDRAIALEAVKTCAEAVAFAARELWTADFFLAAVEANSEALRLCPPQLKNHRRWVLAAARFTGEALHFASEELQGDSDFVLQVLECGCERALEFASPSLLRHPDFILAASRKSDSALRYAAEDLRADPALVRALVSRHGCALQYAAPELRADPVVALAAVQADPAAAEFVAPGLWSDRDFKAAALEEGAVPPEEPPEELKADPALEVATSRPAGEREAALCEKAAEPLEPTPAGQAEESEAPRPKPREPDAKCGAPLRRPRTMAPAKGAGGAEEAAGAESLDFPCPLPGHDDAAAQGKASAGPAAPLVVTSASPGKQQGAARGGNGSRMLPWCFPMPSERYQTRPLVQSGLQNAALQMKIQAARCEPEGEEQEQAPEEGPPAQPEPERGPLASIDEVKLGDHLQVVGDPEEVVRCCRAAGMDFAGSEYEWPASADKYVKVLAVDPMDGSIECRVPGVGDVWLAHAALARVPAEVPLRSMRDVLVGGTLQVLRDTVAVLEACHNADLGSIEDESSWHAAAGKAVEVIGKDPKDRTVECHVPDVGDVWFALAALRAA